MSTPIPSVADIQAQLAPLSHAALQRLAKASGVPFTTIWKIRDGTTKNPGLDTVGQFLPHIPAVKEELATMPGALS